TATTSTSGANLAATGWKKLADPPACGKQTSLRALWRGSGWYRGSPALAGGVLRGGGVVAGSGAVGTGGSLVVCGRAAPAARTSGGRVHRESNTRGFEKSLVIVAVQKTTEEKRHRTCDATRDALTLRRLP